MQEQKRVLAILPELNPSSIILVVEPLMYLLNLGKIKLRLRLEKLGTRFSDLEWADLVIFCRNTEPAYDYIETLQSLGKPYIYELDDNLLELSPDTPEGKYYLAPERLTQLKKYIANASLVRVYSPPLEASIRKHTSKVKLVNAPVNLTSIPSTAPKRKTSKLKIVFPTSRTISDNLSKIFVKDLLRIINEHGKNVEIHFWGFLPEEMNRLSSVKFHKFMPNYRKYMQAMYNEGYDIGLAPMKDDLFHNSKTNNKFREYGACWIAGIYSSTALYSNCVTEGSTGLLVSNQENSWYQAITRLLNDPVLRKNIQEQSRAQVEKHYSLEDFALVLISDIHQLLASYIKSSSPNNELNKNNGDGRHPQPSIFRLPTMIILTAQKTWQTLMRYGWALTYRLILDQVERYIYYIEISLRIYYKNSKT